MRTNWLLAMAACLLSGSLSATTLHAQTGKPAKSSSLPKAVATNQKSFFIPVAVDRKQAGHDPVEVQLLVSADQGKTWSTYARQAADSKGFQFQGRDDGEYWFASRTVDAQGRAKPSEVEVELRIAIDSTPPKIDLDAAVDAKGNVNAAWRVTDSTAAMELVKIDYQSGDSLKPTWQAVQLETGDQQITSGLLTGAKSFTPRTTSRAVDLRIVVRDQAGNIAADTKRVFLPRESRAMVSKLPEWPPRAATTPAPTKSVGSTDPFTARQFEDGGVLNPNTKSAAPTATPAIEPAAEQPQNSGPSPQDRVAAKPQVLASNPLPRETSTVSPPVRDRVVAQPSSTGSSNPLIWPQDNEVRPPAEQAPITPITPSEIGPAPTNPTTTDGPPPSTVGDSSAGNIKPQLTSSKSFALEYDLDSVGPAGVRAVELWVTTDNGETWQKWGEDEDKKSPFDIQVESERNFGFRMVIVSNNGLAGRAPEPGDAADVQVEVDSTIPTARLLQAGYGVAEHSGQLDIRWEAEDLHLGQRPVTISFSESPDGPFSILAAGLPNDGQYYWTIDPRTPRKLYLRLEVRDEAGNVAVDQTLEPISLEGLSPRGRIRAVVPPGGEPRGAFRAPLFR